MTLDFHTHGKLAKYLPFSKEYTDWLMSEALSAGLDAICLTEHFNTQGFDEVYAYIQDHSDRDGDSFIFNGLRIFPGMETDIKEGGHILSIGPMDAIRELNRKIEANKKKDSFLPFDSLMNLFAQYPVLPVFLKKVLIISTSSISTARTLRKTGRKPRSSHMNSQGARENRS